MSKTVSRVDEGIPETNFSRGLSASYTSEFGTLYPYYCTVQYVVDTALTLNLKIVCGTFWLKEIYIHIWWQL